MSLGLGPIGDAVFSFGKSVVKNILGEFVSTTDAKNERGTGAEAAALAKIGFLDEKKVALQMAQAAEQRATRSRDPNEGKPEPSQYARQIAEMYSKTDWTNSHGALSQQIGREKKLDLYKDTTEGKYADETATGQKPMKVE